MDISFVIPCYRSSQTLDAVVAEITGAVADLKITEYEIILVNDCSPDGGKTWETITRLCREHGNIVGINLAKNCGQGGATLAGLRKARGELIAVSDDDGQTPICHLPEMVELLRENDHDIVCAKYIARGQRGLFRRFGSWMSATLNRTMLDCPPDTAITVFFVARRFVVEEMIRYQNPYPYIIGLMTRTTHNIGNIELEQRERMSGASGYNFKRLLSIYMNGFTAFSILPLRMAAVFGFIAAAIGFIAAVVTVIRKIVQPTIAVGYSSLIATILIMSGVILIVLGMIGEYIGRIYLSINNKPQYTIREVLNGEES